MLLAANLGFGVLQNYSKFIRSEFKDDLKMKEPLTILDSTGKTILKVSQHDVHILQECTHSEVDFNFRDVREIGAVDIKAFRQLTIANQEGEIEKLCENPPDEDVMLDSDDPDSALEL